MNPKMVIKVAVDIGMTIALLLLMTYELIGQKEHEWIGIGMFVLFILHHFLNYKWSRNLLKGKYTVFRILQTLLVVLILATMIGSMVSGAILSRHALTFVPIKGGRMSARKLHMISAYWGFILMSLHPGFHWSMMMGLARKLIKKTICCPHMDTSDCCTSDSRLRSLCFSCSADWKLFIFKNTICIF